MSESTNIKDFSESSQSVPSAVRRDGVTAPIEADDSQVVATYTNFFRVMGTPEELIVDFGLNPQLTGLPTQPVKLT